MKQGGQAGKHRVQGVEALNARGLAGVTVGLGAAHQHHLRAPSRTFSQPLLEHALAETKWSSNTCNHQAA